MSAATRLSRRSRRFLRRIQKARSPDALQTIANEIRGEFDSRNVTYDEALSLGNSIQKHADAFDGDHIVYAISDRDAYRRSLEVYLKDGLLTRTEQMLLWDERRKLGITQDEHDRLLVRLSNMYRRQGRSVQIQRFSPPGGASS